MTIVEREFELELRSNRGESKVFARIRMPVPVTETQFRCEVEIGGLEDPISMHGHGVDGVQAYELALQGAALRMLSSPAYQTGRLTFHGSHDLRLPVPDSYRYLVRTDLEREVTCGRWLEMTPPTKRFRAERLARKVWPDKPGDAPVVLERVFDLHVAGFAPIHGYQSDQSSRAGLDEPHAANDQGANGCDSFTRGTSPMGSACTASVSSNQMYSSNCAGRIA